MSRNLNRRGFLGVGAASFVGGWVGPRIVSRRALAAPGRPGANDVLRIGLIGCGIRGKNLIGNLPPQGRVTAICDCYAPRITGTLKPEGMEWELFCGPTELRPYNWRLWQKDERNWEGKRWRGWDMWRDYSGHLVTNWGAHALDMAQWALGMDASGPVEVGPLAGRTSGDPRTCPMVARYATGTELRMTGVKGLSAGGLFHGARGRIAIDRNRFRADPPDLVADPPDPAVAEIWQGPGIVARPHLQNWIDCIKSRAEPNAPVEVGHRTVTICHLVNIARELRRKVSWDPQREVIVGDEEANRLLTRPRRAGWELPEVPAAARETASKD